MRAAGAASRSGSRAIRSVFDVAAANAALADLEGDGSNIFRPKQAFSALSLDGDCLAQSLLPSPHGSSLEDSTMSEFDFFHAIDRAVARVLFDQEMRASPSSCPEWQAWSIEVCSDSLSSPRLVDGLGGLSNCMEETCLPCATKGQAREKNQDDAELKLIATDEMSAFVETHSSSIASARLFSDVLDHEIVGLLRGRVQRETQYLPRAHLDGCAGTRPTISVSDFVRPQGDAVQQCSSKLLPVAASLFKHIDFLAEDDGLIKKLREVLALRSLPPGKPALEDCFSGVAHAGSTLTASKIEAQFMRKEQGNPIGAARACWEGNDSKKIKMSAMILLGSRFARTIWTTRGAVLDNSAGTKVLTLQRLRIVQNAAAEWKSLVDISRSEAWHAPPLAREAHILNIEAPGIGQVLESLTETSPSGCELSSALHSAAPRSVQVPKAAALHPIAKEAIGSRRGLEETDVACANSSGVLDDEVELKEIFLPQLMEPVTSDGSSYLQSARIFDAREGRASGLGIENSVDMTHSEAPEAIQRVSTREEQDVSAAVILKNIDSTMEEDLDSYMEVRGKSVRGEKGLTSQKTTPRKGQKLSWNPLIEESAGLGADSGGVVNVMEVKIRSDSVLGATAYTMRTLTVALLQQLREARIVDSDPLYVDMDYLRVVAENLQSSLDRLTSTFDKSQKAAQWAALMTVFLLHKSHQHLVMSGPVVAGMFIASAMQDEKWDRVIRAAVPGFLEKEVMKPLTAMRDDEELHHPKLVELREIVKKQMQSGQSKTVLLVRSSLIFESAAKALHGVCNEVTYVTLRNATKTFSGQDTSSSCGNFEMLVCTELAFLHHEVAVLEGTALLICFSKPNAAAALLLQKSPHSPPSQVHLECPDPVIDEASLLSGAECIASNVRIDVSEEQLRSDGKEELCLGMFLWRSVNSRIYMSHNLFTQRSLVKQLRDRENIDLVERPALFCDVAISLKTCLLVRTLGQLAATDAVNDFAVLLLELSVSYSHIWVVIVSGQYSKTFDSKGKRENNFIDAEDWGKIHGLLRCYGSYVQVRRVYSEEQLAICIRVAIEDDCGRHEQVTSNEVPQALCSKKSILERLTPRPQKPESAIDLLIGLNAGQAPPSEVVRCIPPSVLSAIATTSAALGFYTGLPSPQAVADAGEYDRAPKKARATFEQHGRVLPAEHFEDANEPSNYQHHARIADYAPATYGVAHETYPAHRYQGTLLEVEPNERIMRAGLSWDGPSYVPAASNHHQMFLTPGAGGVEQMSPVGPLFNFENSAQTYPRPVGRFNSAEKMTRKVLEQSYSKNAADPRHHFGSGGRLDTVLERMYGAGHYGDNDVLGRGTSAMTSQPWRTPAATQPLYPPDSVQGQLRSRRLGLQATPGSGQTTLLWTSHAHEQDPMLDFGDASAPHPERYRKFPQ